MADIHGIPDASMMTPEQSFDSVPLPDLTGSHPLQVNIAAGMDDDGDHGTAMNLPAELTDGDGTSLGLNLASSLTDDGSPG
jgi:hypothetical protein